MSGAKLTRNPIGLIHALQKLEQNDKPFAKFNHATAAMCIDDPLQHHEGWYAPPVRHPPAARGAHRDPREDRARRDGLSLAGHLGTAPRHGPGGAFYPRCHDAAHLHRAPAGGVLRPAPRRRPHRRGVRLRRVLPLRPLPQDGFGQRPARVPPTPGSRSPASPATRARIRLGTLVTPVTFRRARPASRWPRPRSTT